jgi:hypothetical protein
MKRIVAASVLAALTVSPAYADQRVTVPGSTPVKLISDTVATSMGDSADGQELEFHVAEPVIVNGWIVIPADAKAVGHIVKAGGQKARILPGGRSESMTFALDYVFSADGGKIKLDDALQSPPKTKSMHIFLASAGGESVLNKGTAVATDIAQTVHVLAKEKAASSSAGGFDK